MRKTILSAALLIVAAGVAFPQQISFKLTGGLNWIDGNDYNAGVQGSYNYLRAISQTTSGTFKNLTNGPNFQAEIVNYLGPNLGIGLGGGYYRVSSEGQVASHGVLEGVPYDATSTYRGQVSVIPFFLNVHYLARLAPRLKLDLFGGPVFAIVQTHIENPSTSTILSTTQNEFYTASSTSLGVQAGLGLSFEFSRRVSLIAEATYRMAKLTEEIMGNWVKNVITSLGQTVSSSAESFLWTYALTQGGTFTRIGFFDKNGPTGETVSGAKKAVIDLSGLVASVGVKFSF
jgi:hypothetical protein